MRNAVSCYHNKLHSSMFGFKGAGNHHQDVKLARGLFKHDEIDEIWCGVITWSPISGHLTNVNSIFTRILNSPASYIPGI